MGWKQSMRVIVNENTDCRRLNFPSKDQLRFCAKKLVSGPKNNQLGAWAKERERERTYSQKFDGLTLRQHSSDRSKLSGLDCSGEKGESLQELPIPRNAIQYSCLFRRHAITESRTYMFIEQKTSTQITERIRPEQHERLHKIKTGLSIFQSQKRP